MDYCYSWNGLADSGNDNLKYYNNGIVNRNYTGFTIYNGDWYLMKNGSVDTSYTGLYYYNKEWWYLKMESWILALQHCASIMENCGT